MPSELILELGGERSELKRIASAVEQIAQEHGLPEDLSYQIALVLEEVQMNIIKHAYPPDVEPHSCIMLRCEPKSLTIEISDQGQPFNPLENAKEPDLDSSLKKRPVGGLGVYLVKSLMDEVDYRREGDSNYLTLVKALPQ